MRHCQVKTMEIRDIQYINICMLYKTLLGGAGIMLRMVGGVYPFDTRDAIWHVS